MHFYTPPHDSGGILWYHVGCPCVRPSVRPNDNLKNVNGFSPNSGCALILWRSGMGLLMGQFRQFLTALSARDTSVFSFPDYNLT